MEQSQPQPQHYFDRPHGGLSKTQLVVDREIFRILEATRLETGTYGPHWNVSIAREGGEIAVLMIGCSEWRDADMAALVETLAAFGPFYAGLKRSQNAQGNSAFFFARPQELWPGWEESNPYVSLDNAPGTRTDVPF